MSMGMKLFQRVEDDILKNTLGRLGFGTEGGSASVEVQYEWEGDQIYTLGTGYGQLAISCPDVYTAAQQFKDEEIDLCREPGPVPGIGTKICGVRDPDGWKIVMVDAADFEKELK